MCLAQGPQRSDAGEARTRGPSVSSQALCAPILININTFLFVIVVVILLVNRIEQNIVFKTGGSYTEISGSLSATKVMSMYTYFLQ